MALDRIFPPPEELTRLEPEEVGELVLKFVGRNPASRWNLYNFIMSYAGRESAEVKQALAEGWNWLVREGLLITDLSDTTGNFVQLSRRGSRLVRDGAFKEYRMGALLPAQLLDPVLAEKVVHLFLRGDYDTAVFQAFKEVEIRVRTASGLPSEKIGIELMRDAFNAERGPLTDKNLVTAEREAWSHFFTGAIGLFKNPTSHRDVQFKPQEAAELIFLANYLLRVVDSRTAGHP